LTSPLIYCVFCHKERGKFAFFVPKHFLVTEIIFFYYIPRNCAKSALSERNPAMQSAGNSRAESAFLHVYYSPIPSFLNLRAVKSRLMKQIIYWTGLVIWGNLLVKNWF